MINENDIALRLLTQSSSDYTNAVECETMREGSREILKLREQLNRSIGIALRIENLLGSTLTPVTHERYYKGVSSMHQEFKALIKEVRYD